MINALLNQIKGLKVELDVTNSKVNILTKEFETTKARLYGIDEKFNQLNQ